MLNRFESELEKFFLKLIQMKAKNWDKPWIAPILSKPVNCISGRFYNGFNILLLSFEQQQKGYNSNAWLTFKQATELGVSVIKGSKSTPVFFSAFYYRNIYDAKLITRAEYMLLPEDERENFRLFYLQKFFNVFNIDQTTMKEVDRELYDEFLAKYSDASSFPDVCTFSTEKIDHFISLWSENICPIAEELGDEAFYHRLEHKIVLPERTQFKDATSFLGTLLHEAAHSTMKPLDRNLPYAEEELVAELAAAFLQATSGLDGEGGNEAQTSAYLNGWLNSIEEVELSEIVKVVASHVTRIVNFMNDYIPVSSNHNVNAYYYNDLVSSYS